MCLLEYKWEDQEGIVLLSFRGDFLDLNVSLPWENRAIFLMEKGGREGYNWNIF